MSLPRSLGLPDFPWDTLNDAKRKANAHPGGIVDLSVGTPVDPTPAAVQEALCSHADAPGYPLVVGTESVRESIHSWMKKRGMVAVPDAGVIPTTGSKELVAWLPKLLGVGPGDTVIFPSVAYPTYHVSAVLAGANPVAVDPLRVDTWPDDAALVWLNSPSNPTGAVMSARALRDAVTWARARGIVVVADECYAELAWTPEYRDAGVPSLLWPQVCDGNVDGLLVLYSLSKQSNMAGYRGAIMVGDPDLVQATVDGRKHCGFMTPTPVQAAIAAALADSEHVREQHERYRRRRQILTEAVQGQGLIVDSQTQAGLYLWISAPEGFDYAGVGIHAPNRGRQLVEWFAERGILVAPGDFYGPEGNSHVRMALTATDERVQAAKKRLEAGL